MLPIDSLVHEAISSGLFPGCALTVARNSRTVLTRAWGNLTFAPWTPPVTTNSTYFDLASLTKPVATACAIMTLQAKGILDISTHVNEIIRNVPENKAHITIRHLLTHSSGLPAHRVFYRKWLPETKQGNLPSRARITAAVLNEPLEYQPGRQSIYSDPGYMLLGCIIEEVTGMGLYEYVQSTVLEPMHAGELMSGSDAIMHAGYENIAPSGNCPFEHRMIHGEVNDLNARSIGGFAGHAGLFGTAEGLTDMLSNLLDIYHGRLEVMNFRQDTVRCFWTRDTTVPESTWALGFDTPSAHGSSAGRLFSEKSVGHLGFTGTSFWIDPKKDIIVVFLSNRTFPMATNRGMEAMRSFRPGLHDQVMKLIMQAVDVQGPF